MYSKMIAAAIPFMFLFLGDTGTSGAEGMSQTAVAILKFGELGLCLVLIAYLMYSNWSLIRSVQVMTKEQSSQQKLLVNALNQFCAVCHERPCLYKANAFNLDNPHNLTQQDLDEASMDGN